MAVIRINPPYPFSVESGPRAFVEKLGYTFLSWDRTGPNEPCYIEIGEGVVDDVALDTALGAFKPYLIIDTSLDEAREADKLFYQEANVDQVALAIKESEQLLMSLA